MGFCIRHPDRETAYRCQKHEIYLCEACLACRDPNIYCKHRSSCVISFLQKGNGQDPPSSDAEAAAESGDAALPN